MQTGRENERIIRTDLWNKIVLMKDRTPKTSNHAAGTWPAFEAFSKVSRKTLEDGCPKVNGAFVTQSITPFSEGKLVVAYKFEATCKTWTHGTALEFAERWFPGEAKPGTPRLLAERIDERTGSIDADQRLWVSLDLRSQDAETGQRTFDGELICQVFTRIGVRLAVLRGTLKVTCRKDLVPPLPLRLGGEDGEVRVERKANTVTIRSSGRDHMLWDVEADRAPIGILSEKLESLFAVRGLRVGDEFEAAFIVEDRDLVADGAAQSGPALEPASDAIDADNAVVAAGGGSLGPSKRQLMAHVAKHSLGLFGQQQPGQAVLCKYAIRIVAETPPETQGNAS